MVLRMEEEEDFLISINENKSIEEERGEEKEEIEEIKEREEEEKVRIVDEEENEENEKSNNNREKNSSRNRNRNRNKDREIEIDSYKEIDYNNNSENENININIDKNKNKNINRDINRNTNKKGSPLKRYQSQKFIILILSLLLCICLIYFMIDRTLFHHTSELTYATHDKFIMTTSSSNNNDSNNHSHIHSHNEDFIESEELPEGFMYLRKSYPKGPITLDRTRDDGSKLNLYSIMKKTMATTTTTNTSSENPENDEEYDDDNEDKDRVYESFKKLEEILPSQSQYLCELDREKPPEGQKGYILECPKHYTLLIEKAYYGRYENDKINCVTNETSPEMEIKKEKEGEKEWEWEEENEEEEKEKDLSMNLIQYCGIDSTSTMKELCEGQRMCEVKPYSTFFISLCSVRNKYLHVEYHCIKDLEIKTPRIAIVNFVNEIAMERNSIFENSVSEFFQYSQIHGYTYQLYRKRYNTERDIYYMKLNSMIESLILGLKEKTYDWIFWADSDTIIANPNIKLETFLPIGEDGYEEGNDNKEDGNEEEKEKVKEKQKEEPRQHSNSNSIHFIASDDENGLNAGVYLIRVHPWSLNLLMRAMTYSYYHEEEALRYSDQSSLSHILMESGEEEHYVIVPQHWFNSYLHTYHRGDFLIHFAGEADKDWRARDIRMKLRHHISRYTAKTSKEMRKEVLEYYRLPREDQHQIRYKEKKK